MNHRYMTLTLGRGLFYAGCRVKEGGLSDLAAMLKEHSINPDPTDSICYLKSVNDTASETLCAGIALADTPDTANLPKTDYADPGDKPGLFSLPSGKYGFLQLESNADHVIASERKALLEYLNEKGTPGSTEGFFVRTIEEDGREAYQILIPLAPVAGQPAPE